MPTSLMSADQLESKTSKAIYTPFIQLSNLSAFDFGGLRLSESLFETCIYSLWLFYADDHMAMASILGSLSWQGFYI